MVSFCFLCEFLEINSNGLKRSLKIDNTLTGLDNLNSAFAKCACARVCVKSSSTTSQGQQHKSKQKRHILVKTVKINMQKSLISFCKSIISTDIRRQSCRTFPLIVGTATVNVQNKSKPTVRMNSSWGYGVDNGEIF